MKLRFLHGTLCILFSTLLFSQVGINSPASNGTLGGIASEARSPQDTQMASLNGKVISESGSDLPLDTTVILQCAGSERARISADRQGDFALQVSVVQNEMGSTIGPQVPGAITSSDWAQCELYGEAPGYESEHLHLSGPPSIGIVQAGTIILHSRGQQVPSSESSFAVSATTLAAPDKARKAFEKGEEQERKGMWAAARECFTKAVEVYPRYAVAWLELGRAQLNQNDFADAQQSFHRATDVDPQLLDGYVQIAKIAIKQHDWKNLADSTQNIVQLSRNNAANFWFLNSAANFNLGNIAQAETSALRGLRLDPNHHLPQLEYLYGMILSRKGDYNSAISHVQNYLRLSPDAQDATEAQTRLSELQKIAASANANTASR